jgi:HEAT repeat protein
MATLFETFAMRFARCVDLFRDPNAKEAQKAEFRAVLGLLADAPVTLRAAGGGGGGGIEVNGVACAGPAIAALAQRLDLHGVAEIAIPAAPPPAELFALFRILADQPSLDDVPARLAAAGAGRIRVTNAGEGQTAAPVPPPPPGAQAPGAAPESFRPAEPVIPSPEGAARAAPTLGTTGILRGEAWRDIPSVPLTGVPLVMHDPPPPPAADALPGAAAPPPAAPDQGARSAGAPPPGSSSPVAGAEAPGAGPQPGPRPGHHPGPELAAAAPLPPEAAAALAALERMPGGPGVPDQLAVLVHAAEAALQQSRAERLLAIVTGLVRIEQRLPEASGMRRQYAIALRRIGSRRALEALGQLVAVPGHRAAAVAALRRYGSDAVEVLLAQLVAAPAMAERRAVFDALRQMQEGTDQLVHMLDHHEWFVVRNVAELVGELEVEQAVPALARRLEHPDERVRKAVALALAKIGTRSAVEPLRRALRDRSPDVRVHVALGIGGRRAAALAMPLVAALDEEKDEAVQRELILALGRIGSPDAVQALIRFAQPSGRLFGRRPTAVRVAAVEALRLAATAPALGTLEGLCGDSDRQVRAAARAAVAELGRKP